MKKIIASLVALLLIASALPCFAEYSFPVTITTYNRSKEAIEVTVESAPEKVVVAYQNNIEIMLALGLEDRIIYAFGLDEEITGDLADAFATIPYYEERPSKEEVIAMEPDCILGWYSLFADDRLGDVDYWLESGVTTYMAIDSGCLSAEDGAQTIEAEMQDILNIGAMFGVSDKAQEIVDEIYAEIEVVTDYVEASGLESLSVAILENEGDSYRVYGTDTIGGNIAETVGATLAIGAEDSENIGAEDLIAADPDVVFMIYYEGYNTPEEAVSDIADNQAFASLSAVQNGKVYALSLTETYCSGLHTLDGIQTFASALYPDLYE